MILCSAKQPMKLLHFFMDYRLCLVLTKSGQMPALEILNKKASSVVVCFFYIIQKDSTVLCICSVTDHIGHQMW